MIAAVARWLVWPTPRGWGLIAAAVAGFFVAMVNPSVPAALFCACLWGLVGASLLLSMTSVFGVEIERQPCTDGVMGQMLPQPVLVTNRSIFRRQALLISEAIPFAQDKWSFTVVEPLAGRERRHLRRPIFAARRGEFRLDRIKLRGGDPAGLFYREKVFSFPQALMIYPERIPVAWMPLRLRSRVQAAPMGQAVGASGAGEEFFGVREYRPTDGQRAIHWKASARQGKLMVRQFEENNINQVSIFLDTHQGHVAATLDNNFEYLVKVAASIAEYLSGTYVRVLFRAAGESVATHTYDTSQSVRNEIMHRLATITPGQGGLTNLLLDSIDLVPGNSIVYCLTLYEPQGMEEVFEYYLSRGVDVRWIHAPPVLFSDRVSDKRKDAVDEFARRSGRLLPPLIVNPRTQVQQLLSYG